MNTAKYDRVSRALHWISAFVILWATISGFYIVFANIEEHIKAQIAEINVSVTTLFIPLFCIRIFNRLCNKAPTNLGVTSLTEEKLAKWMHSLLYILVSIVLLSGVLMMEAPIVIFDFFEFTQLLESANLIEFYKLLHNYSTQILGILIFIHILALVKHELTGKRILRRMI